MPLTLLALSGRWRCAPGARDAAAAGLRDGAALGRCGHLCPRLVCWLGLAHHGTDEARERPSHRRHDLACGQGRRRGFALSPTQLVSRRCSQQRHGIVSSPGTILDLRDAPPGRRREMPVTTHAQAHPTTVRGEAAVAVRSLCRAHPATRPCRASTSDGLWRRAVDEESRGIPCVGFVRSFRPDRLLRSVCKCSTDRCSIEIV